MFILFLILVIISALLLILLVMVQDDQGEGLGGIFGGGSSTPFGSTSGNILTRATTVVAIVFMVSVFVLALVNKTSQDSDIRQAAQERQFQESQENTWFIETNAAEDTQADSDEDVSSLIGDNSSDDATDEDSTKNEDKETDAKSSEGE